MDLSRRWSEHLRRTSRESAKTELRCPVCGHLIPIPESSQNGSDFALTSFEKHFSDLHAQLLDDKATETEKRDLIQIQWEAAQASGDMLVLSVFRCLPTSPPHPSLFSTPLRPWN